MKHQFYSLSPARTTLGRLLCGAITLLFGLVQIAAIGFSFSPAYIKDPIFYVFAGWGVFWTVVGLVALSSLRKVDPIEFIRWDGEFFMWGRKNGDAKTIPIEDIHKIRILIDFENNLRVTILHAGSRKTHFPYLFDRVLLPRGKFLGSSSGHYTLTKSREQFYDYLRKHHSTIAVDLPSQNLSHRSTRIIG